jgi:serine/threonine protein kinase/Tfp pilus assembly protein PilF
VSASGLIGQTVGAYRLTGVIGHGGMGTVYRAVRADDQFEKTVAIKVLRFPDGSPAELERFLRERQILASLEHPGIARLLDGGAWAPPGSTEPQPYIVMEYVEGLPLTTYAEQQKLALPQRLQLFRRICDALSYAHRQLVVHRDVKPGNILVTAEGNPKLLDFGVSKLLASESVSDAAALTTTGFAAMTPDYASPEQVRGGPVSTLTDVYTLGAVLYELLAGRRAHQFSTHDPLVIAREICEREVEPPGINGELDLIVLKAMQKEPVRRYQSVDEFSQDIHRYLSGLPIIARPDTLSYRAAKFVRRHSLALAAAGVLLLALIGGISVSTWEARRANKEAAVAQAVNDFLQNDVLAQANVRNQAGPSTKPDPDLKVRTALDRAAARIAGKFDRQPELEAAIRYTIADTYLGLGLYQDARTHFERALELRRRVLGAQNPETLNTVSRLGMAAFLQGKYPEAETLLSQTLEMERRVLGPEHPNTLSSMNSLARVYGAQGKYPQAEALHSKTLEIQRRVLGAEHPDTLASMDNLATLYRQEGKYPQAEALHSKTLEIRRRVLGPEHPDTLASMNSLANVYSYQAKYGQAEALYSQTLEIKRRVLGAEHPDTLFSMNNLAAAYSEQGKYGQAEALFSQTLEIKHRVLGTEHPNTLASMNNLAVVYRRDGKYAQAEALYSQILEIKRPVLGAEHRDTLTSMNNLAVVYRQEGKYAQAEALYSETLAIQRRVLGPEHPGTLVSMHNLANVYYSQGKNGQAEALYSQTLEIDRRVLGPEHYDTLSTLSDLASMYQRQAKYALAETHATQALAGLRHNMGPEHPDTIDSALDVALAYLSQGKFSKTEALAREAFEFGRKKQPDDWKRFRAESLLGASFAGEKKYAEGEPLLVEGYRGMLARKDRIAVPDHYHLDLAHKWLVDLYEAWGKPEKAAEWRAQPTTRALASSSKR